MLYSSKNGYFYYYDAVLYRWNTVEPTLLFILGLEAVTTYDKSLTDSIILSKYVYKSYIDKVEPLEYIHNIYDTIYLFLSSLGAVEDNEAYLKFNCHGLKLLLNSLTGTNEDRTVPIIFKYDKNNSLLEQFSLQGSTSSKSYYDTQSDIIYNIFKRAGYEDSLTTSNTPEYYINRSSGNVKTKLDALNSEIRQLTKEINSYNPEKSSADIEGLKIKKSKLEQEIKAIINSITLYNSKITDVHNNAMTYSNMYKLLDYKAMYSYALGVLFGCRCLGFDDSVIWRLDPKLWYNGNYYNLVRTAWFVFRFHWAYSLSDKNQISANSYVYSDFQDIVENKIWNFSNDNSLIKTSLKIDETNCFCMYLDENINDSVRANYNISKSILYSNSTMTDTPSDNEAYGSYLRKYISSKDGSINWKWTSIKDSVSNDKPLKGVVSTRDISMTRYIGNDEVTIYRAYKYDIDNETYYLAPKSSATDIGVYKKYYVYTGNLGWVAYQPDTLYDLQDEHPTDNREKHNYLSIVQSTPTYESLYYGLSSDTTNPHVITYYKCYVTDKCVTNEDGTLDDADSDILYGIYDTCILESKTIPTNFDYIISSDLFNKHYKSVESIDYDGIASTTFYSLDVAKSLIIEKDSYPPHIYGDTSNNSVYSYGYSDSPSKLVTLYKQNYNTKEDYPLNDSFRFYIVMGDRATSDIYANYKYWLDSTEDKIHDWVSLYYLNTTYFTVYYTLTNKTTNIYRGEQRVLSDEKLYNNYLNKITLNNSSLDNYIYNVPSKFINNSYDDSYQFLLISNKPSSSDVTNLYSSGITTYLCPFILKDDNGNSLLDDKNKALVWYDPKNKVYWNGLFNINRWQATKPNKDSKMMYNTITKQLTPVFDNIDDKLISIDGDNAITYDEFYSHTNYGVIRTSLYVFNPVYSISEIKDCYCDTLNNPDNCTQALYCIPDVTDGQKDSKWLSRGQITALGWRFVDGTSSLYTGNTRHDYIIDDDPID